MEPVFDMGAFLGTLGGGAGIAGVLAWFMREYAKLVKQLLTIQAQTTEAITQSTSVNSRTLAVLVEVSTTIDKCRRAA